CKKDTFYFIENVSFSVPLFLRLFCFSNPPQELFARLHVFPPAREEAVCEFLLPQPPGDESGSNSASFIVSPTASPHRGSAETRS
ncbi:MAG: hypothetical protein ACI3XP_04325, partial [Eubacteriales bacterium]